MERRSPTGIDRREAVETPKQSRSRSQRQKAGSKQAPRCRRTAAAAIPSSEKRGNGAPVSDRHRQGGRNRQAAPGRSRQRPKPSGFAAISFPAVLTHRSGGDPQQRKARKWSAGLRPASTAERRSKPHQAKPLQVAAAKGGQQTLRVRCHQFQSRGADAPRRRVRSPKRGCIADLRDGPRKWSAGLRPASTADRRSKPPKPAGAEARKWSAGLRPASRPERAAKPRYPTPSDEADDHGQSCARSQRPAFTGLFRM